LKNKKLLITTTIFFLIINTVYYWEGKLGFFAFPAFLILVVVCFGLVIALLSQMYFAVKEKLANKTRLINIVVLTLVLTLTFLKPFGLIDFDKLEGENVLIAEREGAANCMTTLKLKDNFTFSERGVCFGVMETKGNYHFQNDTIFFDNVKLGPHQNEFYMFAVVKPSKFSKDGKQFNLVRYKNLQDTIGHELWVSKNELDKYKNKKPNR